MNFRRYLEQTSKKLDYEIQKILNQWLKEVGKINKKLVPLANQFIKANFGGKRIRGSLVKLGYEIACPPSGGPKTPRNDIIKVGAAYEVFHTAILTHDDIIDQSKTRRGQISLYQKIGTAQAMTLGDLGFFLAIKIISQSNFPDKYKNRALTMFAKIISDTALGQLLDIEKADPITTARLKTAYYTIAGPLQLGAMLAGLGPTSPLRRQSGYGASETRLRGIKEFGENLGIAFQIRDDILDGEVKSVDEAEAKVLEYTDKARKLIPKLTDRLEMRKLLEEMVDYMVDRSW